MRNDVVKRFFRIAWLRSKKIRNGPASPRTKNRAPTEHCEHCRMFDIGSAQA